MALKPKTVAGTEAVKLGAEARSRDGLLSSSPEEEIRRRAFEIYLGRGEEPGNEIEDWLQAERELMGDQFTVADK
jgi:hypothetical protein